MPLSDKNSMMQVIGCLMKNTTILSQADRYDINFTDFDDLLNRYIYQAIQNFYASGARTISVVDLDNFFQERQEIKNEYEKRNGLEYIKDCEGLSNPDTFDYYYNRLKKYSLLRSLKKSGFDISYFYCDNPLAANYKETQERFEQADISTIFDEVKKRLSIVEKEYNTSDLNTSAGASVGLRELVQSLKKKPEIGQPLSGSIYNTVVSGARLGKYYIRSAGSGVGKTRLAVGDACRLAIPKYYDWHKECWVDTGLNNKILFITTELDRDEVQTMLLANVSGVNEDKILNAECNFLEEKIIDEALDIIECFNDNFILDKIPDPSINQIEACVRNHKQVDQIEYVFYDYIFSSPGLLSEFKSNNLREDVQLFLLSTALKDLATELHIFMSSSTQLSGDFKNGRGVRDQSFIRSSKAVADKADVGCIMVRISDEEKATISPLIESLGLPMPTHVIDVYKNRRSRYNQVKIWTILDLGTCREKDILITTGDYEEIKDFKEIKFKTAYFLDTEKLKNSVEGSDETELAPEIGLGNEEQENEDMEVNEEVIVAREDFKEPKEELPPFNSPLTITSAESSTYIENEIDFQKKPKIKKVSSRLL